MPSREAGQLVESIQPLADHLSETLGIPVEGYVSSDYTALVTAMETGQAHIAALPPFGLVQAVDRAGAEMILQSERYGSPSYHTQFFTTNVDKYCMDEPVRTSARKARRCSPSSTATAPIVPSTSRSSAPSDRGA